MMEETHVHSVYLEHELLKFSGTRACSAFLSLVDANRILEPGHTVKGSIALQSSNRPS